MENFEIVLTLAVSVITFSIGQKKGAKKEGENQGRMLNDLDHLKENLSELKITLDEISPKISILTTEIEHCKEDLFLIKENYHANKK